VTLCCQDLFYVGQLWSDEPLVPVAADPVTVHRHNIEPQKLNGIEFAVADLSLAESGRHQIRLAEHEMPGLMATAGSTRCPSRSPARGWPDHRT
jgi:hypothetical protein